MKIKDWDIKLCNDWQYLHPDLINIELLSFHLERDCKTHKVSVWWITILGFGIWAERDEELLEL